MVGASRMMGRSRAFKSEGLPPSSASSPPPPSSSSCSRPSLRISRRGGEKIALQGRQRVAVSPENSVVSPLDRRCQPSTIEEGNGNWALELLSSLVAQVARAALQFFGLSELVAARISWRLQLEILIERGVIGCQSFSLLAVAGSLIGSILCFVEGCFLVLESFVHYFHTIARSGDQAGVIRLLIEAIDMFLVGSALLTFGMGLYVMFTGSDEARLGKEWPNISKSNIKWLPAASIETHSISHAKSKLGHAIVLILQAGVVDKFKTVPLSSGVDLACFAGAVLISSACVFLLSRLTVKKSKSDDESTQRNRALSY